MVRQLHLTLIPVHFPIVMPGDNLAQVVYGSLKNQNLTLRRGDVLAVASKIVSICERRVARFADIRVSALATRLSRRWRLDKHLAAVIVEEADEILGGVNGFLLTVKKGILTPNAGVDLKNSPPGTATLWPSNPDRSANLLRRSLERRFQTRIGVVIVDSHVTALRLGTVGLAIGLSGFVPVRDHRGARDLFARQIRVTQTNVADDIAAAAHLLMGESSESIGAVVVQGSDVGMITHATSRFVKLNRRKCLIGNSLVSLTYGATSRS